MVKSCLKSNSIMHNRRSAKLHVTFNDGVKCHLFDNKDSPLETIKDKTIFITPAESSTVKLVIFCHASRSFSPYIKTDTYERSLYAEELMSHNERLSLMAIKHKSILKCSKRDMAAKRAKRRYFKGKCYKNCLFHMLNKHGILPTNPTKDSHNFWKSNIYNQIETINKHIIHHNNRSFVRVGILKEAQENLCSIIIRFIIAIIHKPTVVLRDKLLSTSFSTLEEKVKMEIFRMADLRSNLRYLYKNAKNYQHKPKRANPLNKNKKK